MIFDHCHFVLIRESHHEYYESRFIGTMCCGFIMSRLDPFGNDHETHDMFCSFLLRLFLSIDYILIAASPRLLTAHWAAWMGRIPASVSLLPPPFKERALPELVQGKTMQENHRTSCIFGRNAMDSLRFSLELGSSTLVFQFPKDLVPSLKRHQN